MIDLARRVSSRDTGVSALKQLVFHGRVICGAKLNVSELVVQMMFSPLNGAVMHFVLDSQVMTNVDGQKMMNVVNY
jgi:hypothetical protein